ncbi:MAG: hypothetical protein COU25_00960 [Candidatus Levybacteria bacterium CG10_big_fil_rev_8_21_14_0_10_35_13]|nr:MAG: hypothetical protein COU25_00960 [Candidatus Levybacteria bacterium CG10_big_fil_rev_8_21_14_0_10_35_13]
MSIEKSPIRTIIVANNREYFSPIDPLVSDSEKQEFVESDYDEADMDIMWHGDDKIVLLPRELDSEFVSDVSRLFGFKNIHFIVPLETGAGLSQDIVNDRESFQAVINEISRGIDPQIIPWGHTHQFQSLLNSLTENGLIFRTPETPKQEGLWIPDYLDTKSGSREFLLKVKQKYPDLEIKIPEGFVCNDLDEALQKIDYFTSRNKGVVLKANLGGSGIGVSIFGLQELSDPEKRQEIEANLKKNELFRNGKVAVEERIEADFSHHGIDPSVDAIVKENGLVELQAIDAMVIHHEGQSVGFYGCIGGKDLFNPSQQRNLREFTLAVGQELSELGYRGWYDTDYILTPEGNFYAAEVNLRRTSMCYVVDVAKLLFGEDWESSIAVRTNDKFIREGLQGVSYEQLKNLLSGLMYPIDEERRGVIITQSMRSKFGRGKFGYLIFGKDQDETKIIEEQLEQRIGSL